MAIDADVEYKSGFILRPDQYYSPSYRISPFQTSDIATNLSIVKQNKYANFVWDRFENKEWRFTQTGKHAIALALSVLELTTESVVTVLTTSGNKYVSKCVTEEIDKVCSWSREFCENTEVIFVIHEFGYPFRDLEKLRSYGLPIIEDACHAYYAETPNNDLGLIGDFILFSLPKAYPVQLGGILAFNPKYRVPKSEDMDPGLVDYLSSIMGFYGAQLDEFRNIRIGNYRSLVQRFDTIGCRPWFDLLKNDVPGAFLFSPPLGTNLPGMRQYGWNHGIECSIFYGEDAFFIPVHHRLEDSDLDYFLTVFKDFLNG